MSDFFILPIELRNLVYDELWKLHNCVAAYHKYTASGILAYYNGIDLTLQKVIHIPEVYRVNATWTSIAEAGLPKWLLGNKQMLREGIGQFRLKARWNIWPVCEPENSTPWKREGNNMIMSPCYAESISLQPIGNVNRYARNIRGFVAEFSLPTTRQIWLSMLIPIFEDAERLRALKITINFSKFLVHLAVTEPVAFDIPFPSLLADLVNACKVLQMLEVKLYHWQFEAHHTHQAPETDYLEQFKLGIVASLRHEFSETVTKTPSTVQNEWCFGSIEGKLLFDHKLVYTRKSKEEL